jgi:hypothetical protein
MNAIQDAVEYIEAAIKILDAHANNPKNYNNIYAADFELKSWELYKIANEIKNTSNRYGVA